MPHKRFTIAVITDEYEDAHGALSCNPFEIGDGIVIARTPDFLKHGEVVRDLGWPIKDCVEQAKFAFIKEYEADGLGAEHDEALSHIRDCNLALWIAQPSRIGFRYEVNLLFVESDEPFRQHIGLCEPMLCSPSDACNSLTIDDLLKAKDMYKNMPQEGSVRTAILALARALTESNWATRYLVLWIGLEALFGPDDAREMTHRIAERIAMFNGSGLPGADRKTIYRQVKDCYGWRSKIVHGLKLGSLTPQKSGELRDTSERFIRDALTHILLDPAILTEINGSRREQYLDELVFGV